MIRSLHKPTPRQFILATLPWVSLLACSLNAQAAESYKLRQAPIGAFGGEIAAPADNPDFLAQPVSPICRSTELQMQRASM
jgi:hypothetical protein